MIDSGYDNDTISRAHDIQISNLESLMCVVEAKYFMERLVCRKSSLETTPGMDTTEKFPQTTVSLSDEILQLITGEWESLKLSSRTADIMRLVIRDGASSSVKNYFKTERKPKYLYSWYNYSFG